MSTRVSSRARAVIATGRRPAVVARVAGVSRQGLYRPISRRPRGAGPGHGKPGDDAIVQVAHANPVDGTRMVAALASRQLGAPVNRKRVQRVMRAHGLLQRSRNTDRRRRPGYFRVTRPNELWHMDSAPSVSAFRRGISRRSGCRSRARRPGRLPLQR